MRQEIQTFPALSGGRIGYEYRIGSGADRRVSYGCRGSGGRNGYQPACFLRAVPAFSDARSGGLSGQPRKDPGTEKDGSPDHHSRTADGIQNMVISFSNVLVQSSVNGFGAAAMAGFGAYMKIDGFNILPVMSFSMAVTTFTGQNYGAGKIDRVKKGMWVTLAMGFVYTVLTGVLLLTFADPLMRMFTKDAEVIAFGKQAMRYFCPFYFLLSIMHGLAGTVRGTGKSVPPMVILLTSLCLFRIIWIQFVLPLFSTIDGVFVLYPVSWAFGTVLMILYTWEGKMAGGEKRILSNVMQ